jgi:hypothetical protein
MKQMPDADLGKAQTVEAIQITQPVEARQRQRAEAGRVGRVQNQTAQARGRDEKRGCEGREATCDLAVTLFSSPGSFVISKGEEKEKEQK